MQFGATLRASFALTTRVIGGPLVAGYRQSLLVVPDETFGSLLRARRFRDNLTQADLGRRLGVRQQTVGAWERGMRPQSRFFEPLVAYLGLSSPADLERLLEREADLDQQSLRQSRHGDGSAAYEDERAALTALIRSFTRRMDEGEVLSSRELEVLGRSVDALERFLPDT